MTQVAPTRYNLLAIIGFVGLFFHPIIGIVLGYLARKQIVQTGEEGAGLAKAAFILGIVFTALQAVFIVVWCVLFFGSFWLATSS